MTDPPTITRSDLEAKLDLGDPVTLVEALPEGYYRKAHLPGAINLPPDRIRDVAPRLLPDEDAETVVYCTSFSCGRSSAATETLLAMGYRNVKDYEGGKQDWTEAGLPTERENHGTPTRRTHDRHDEVAISLATYT